MKLTEIKKLIISSLNENRNSDEASMTLSEATSYDFSDGFTGKVLSRIFPAEVQYARQIEFSRYLNLAFSRIALTGVAAIVLLLLSIFLMEGNLSFDSIIGVGDTQAESIVCLLTGN